MIGGKIIKVCGMREGENILAIEALGIDMMGFIFYGKSPRNVESRPSYMPCSAKRVGVFVNENAEIIEQRIREFSLDYVQLHGGESPEFCAEISELGVKIIKAFSVDENFDFALTESYLDTCDMFVFDTKCSGYGGSGEQFDWSLLSGYQGTTPFLLSGGISEQSATSLRCFSHPQLAGYDLNSRFESSPAVKQVEKLNHFFEQLKQMI